MKEWHAIAENIKIWVKEAGEELLAGMERSIEINQKSSSIDLVTEMDVWVENFLVDKIKTTYPGHAILTEEGEGVEGEGTEWVIDPIDGTTNYAHGIPMFCISVGVKVDGETVIGVVYAPKLGEMYEAVKGQGAYLNGRRIRVSETKELKSAVVATGFPYDRATDPLNNVKQFNSVVLEVGGIRRTGSAAIDLCQVAAGRFDGFWEFKLNPWDFTAGLLLVEEAGGKTKSDKMEKGYFILVGNNEMYEELQRLLLD